MKPSGLVLLACCSALPGVARAADATSPVDYTQRNAPFTPSGNPAVAPAKQTPATNTTVQEKRVDKALIDKQTTPLADRRAGLELKEAREKSVREKDSHRPDTVQQPTSAFNHRKAAISTSADTSKPPTVAKYQDSLTAASATNMARFPAMDRATGAKINRFVFRKNPTESSAPMDGKSITPVAGGGIIEK